MKNKIFIKTMVLVVICMITANLYSLSDGGFNVTGAPGEGDCSGCHSGSGTNSDPNGIINIKIDSSNGFYEPGKSYPVQVTISYPGKTRFGFAFTSRQIGSTFGVGTFNASAQSGVFNRSEFVAHTQASTSANNQKTWNFSWKAPDSVTGDINFYLAALVANANNSNTGDLVYTKSITLKRANPTGINPIDKSLTRMRIFPLPATDVVYIQDINTDAIEQAILYDVRGNAIQNFNAASMENIGNNLKLYLDDRITSGVYFLYVKQVHSLSYCKIYVQ